MSGIYKSAKVKDVPRKLPTRVSLVKIFAFIFQKELSQRMDEIESIHKSIPIGSEIAFELQVFVHDALNCINKILNLKNGITVECKAHVEQLNNSLVKFKSATQHLTKANIRIDANGTNPLVILTDDCQHFINQFWITCDLYWASKKLPFRPTDRLLKLEFLTAVIYYSESVNTEKFPPYLWILKQLKVTKKTISERTYGLWKDQLENETFHHFAQPKKKFGNK